MIFEATDSTYYVSNIETISSSPTAILGLIAAGFILFVVLKFTPLAHSISQQFKTKPHNIVWFSVLFILISALPMLSGHWDSYRTKRSIASNEILSITGCITEHLVSESSSREESFSVSSIQFTYNDFATPKYFFANRNHDKFIKNGRCIAIVYLPGDTNSILKIDKV